jgi:hypothetical protein
MALPTPNLDDRDFHQLVTECKRRVEQFCPQWTDLSPSDPGMVLLELFAHLTEVMIYRLNRLPDKAYVEFLRLMGVQLLPPAAARVILKFSVPRPASQDVVIPEGTRVTVASTEGGQEPPIFNTLGVATLAKGNTEILTPAYHCELIKHELVGKGTGLPGLAVTVRRPPIVARLEHRADLEVGVEALPGELDGRAPAVEYGGKAYRIWREVDDFVDLGPDNYVYVADRVTGVITFAPALYRRTRDAELAEQPRALAEIPAAGREIRVSYCRGGGLEGNVVANALTVLKDAIPGVTAINPEPAKGGRPAESLENALQRGPLELHSLHRAVTAEDFTLLALRESGSVARAKAFTKAAMWRHATPGTVEVLLVPDIPDELRSGRLTPELIKENETEAARARIQAILEERRPLGTTCLVGWVRYKLVRVRARIVVHREENPVAVRERVLQRLHQTISPLPTREGGEGWRFGQSLRAFQVYDIVLAEPGVHYIDQVRLLVDESPDSQVSSLAADAFQPQTWYSATADKVFRSANDADGWERVGRFPDERVKLVRPHPARPGLVAVVTELSGESAGHRVHLSRDCGESWAMVAQTAFAIDDIGWLYHKEVATLLLATDVGLYELALQPGGVPLQILVDPKDHNRGFFAVAVSDVRGDVHVAVAARAGGGIFLSTHEGRANTFKSIGLDKEDVRVLEVQKDGPRRFLWAGVTTPGFEAGRGCFRFELTSPDEGWTHFRNNWNGGSCLGMAFLADKTLAASHHAGVLWIDSTRGATEAAWQAPEVKCGLPMRDLEKFQRVNSVAVDPAGQWLLAAGPEGICRSRTGGVNYELASTREFVDQVTLPENWLFCSGEHEIAITNEDALRRD